MKWWLIGQLIPMAVLGAGTMLGLWLLGVPLAFALGLLTGSMLFLPYVGSVIAYLPTALVALTLGPGKLISVTVLYLAVHIAEGYVVTPLVQRRAVKLPPALTLSAQLLLWEFAGLLGVIAATPLAAVSLVLVQRLYLHEQPNAND
jgi:predicted PurR-regulated permease PerM